MVGVVTISTREKGSIGGKNVALVGGVIFWWNPATNMFLIIVRK